MTFKNKLITGVLLAAATGGIVWLGLSVGRNDSQNNLRRADIVSVGGGEGNLLLGDTTACRSDSDTTLSVEGGSGTYDWYVMGIFSDGEYSSASYDVLTGTNSAGQTIHGGDPLTPLEGLTGTVTFKAPNNLSLTDPHYFQINAVDSGAEPNWDGVVFDVNIAPPCVTKLEFTDPSPINPVTPDPTDNSVTIKGIRATFSSGTPKTYTTDDTDFNALMNILRVQATPDTGVRIAGNKIIIPQNHEAININLSINGRYIDSAATTPVVTASPLIIAANSCMDLKANIVQGEGEGFTAGGPASPLDPVMIKDEVRTIYSQGGTQGQSGVQYAWKSSDNNVIEVKALTDQPGNRTLLNNSNVGLSANLLNPDTKFTITTQATAKNCQSTTTGTAPNQVTTLNSCDVDVSALVTYNFQGEEYPVTITTPTGPLANKTVTGQGVLSGTITGATSRISKASGGTIRATGTLTGNVGGDAIGGVIANVTIVYSIAADQLVETDMSSRTTVVTKTGTLIKSDTLIPTEVDPRGQGDAVVTNFAVLKAKTPGSATILVTDQATGCTAPLDIEVKSEKITVEKLAQTPSDIIEVGDSLQVKALRGFRHTEDPVADDRTDITNSVTWTSDNTQVATVSNTGRVTAIAPGTANITAAYTRQGEGSTSVVSEGRVTIRVNAITDLDLTLDLAAIAQLSQDQKAEINKTIALAINSISVVSKTLTIQGHPFTIGEPSGTFTNKIDHIKAIRDALITDINTVTEGATGTGVVAVAHPTLVGVMVLNKSDHTALMISATADPQDLTIQPQVSRTVTLDRTLTYPAQLLAEYDNGLTRRFTSRTVTWVNTPINTLHDASLQGGLFKAGEIRGASRVHVKIENNGLGREVVSNDLTFEVPNKPFVEYAQIVGNSTVVRGATLQLAIKVTDADTMGDLQNIEVLLAKVGSAAPAPTTFDAIVADSATQIFNIQTFLDQVTVNPPATPPVVDPPPAGDQSGFIPAAYAEDADTVVQPFSKIFTLPIKIPELADLTDGTYKLLVQITDKSGQSVKFVRDIQVGVAASGDVNGDGRLNINDAIMAFRFFTAAATPTTNQLAAIDLDHSGQIDLTEVITLLRKIL